jgi:hypothetical protein
LRIRVDFAQDEDSFVNFESAISFLDSSDLLFALLWVVLLVGAFIVAFPDSSASATGRETRTLRRF